jgi:hypothetical protein
MTVGSQNKLGWIRVACDSDRWRHLWTSQWCYGFHKKQRISWSTERATSFILSRRTLLHGVSQSHTLVQRIAMSEWITRLSPTKHVRSVILTQWRAQNIPSVEYNSFHDMSDYILTPSVPLWCSDMPYIGCCSVSMFLMSKPKSCKYCLIRLFHLANK